MVVLKVERTEDGDRIVLDADAIALMGGSAEFVRLQRNDRGEVTIRAVDAGFVEQLEQGRKFIKRYEKTFQTLAKS